RCPVGRLAPARGAARRRPEHPAGGALGGHRLVRLTKAMARTIIDLDNLPYAERRPPRRTRHGRNGQAPIFRPTPPPAWKHIDLTLLVCVAGVSTMGALMILSSTRGTDPNS